MFKVTKSSLYELLHKFNLSYQNVRAVPISIPGTLSRNTDITNVLAWKNATEVSQNIT